MSTGIITTAIVLIVGYVIVSRIIGLAFRLAIPLVLIAILGGASIFSSLMPDRTPERYPVDHEPYGQVQRSPTADVGDLRLRDVADMAVDAIRSVLQGGLAFLNRVSDPEPAMRPRPLDAPYPEPRGRPHEAGPDFYRDPPPRDTWRSP